MGDSADFCISSPDLCSPGDQSKLFKMHRSCHSPSKSTPQPRVLIQLPLQPTTYRVLGTLCFSPTVSSSLQRTKLLQDFGSLHRLFPGWGRLSLLLWSHSGSPGLGLNVTPLCFVFSRSVVSNSLRPHGQQPTKLLCSWDFPGKNTGVGCHFPLQGIFPTQGSNP